MIQGWKVPFFILLTDSLNSLTEILELEGTFCTCFFSQKAHICPFCLSFFESSCLCSIAIEPRAEWVPSKEKDSKGLYRLQQRGKGKGSSTQHTSISISAHALMTVSVALELSTLRTLRRVANSNTRRQNRSFCSSQLSRIEHSPSRVTETGNQPCQSKEKLSSSVRRLESRFLS